MKARPLILTLARAFDTLALNLVVPWFRAEKHHEVHGVQVHGPTGFEEL